MQFVRTEDLKVGMRLARPIYNKNGVLLYERDSKLTAQGIASIRNFELIGLFILEPAEPVPPMTAEDIEFERFQTVSVFAIQEELTRIWRTGKAQKIQIIVANIIKNYGRSDHKVNFIQNLRSREDYMYKHTLNAALLSAMMARRVPVSEKEQNDVVTAAIVHDIGRLGRAKELAHKQELTVRDEEFLNNAIASGFDRIEEVFASAPDIRRICVQSRKGLKRLGEGEGRGGTNLLAGSRILMAAKTYDAMTAMKPGQQPDSPVKALYALMRHDDWYGMDVVNALTDSIHILSSGVCVELNTGEKGLVIAENAQNILRPVILTFRDNQVLDLSEGKWTDLEIVDVMRTLDNRYILNKEELRAQGYFGQDPAALLVR